MTEKRLTVMQEVAEANVTRVVFGQIIDAMDTDVFDGSREEQHIFMETLKVMSAQNGNNCCATSNIMNFHKDQNILLNSLGSSSCESSVLASNSSINNSYTKVSQPACNGAEVSRSKGCVNNFSSDYFPDLYDARVKAMKSSFEQPKFKGVALLPGSSLPVTCDDLCDELVDLNQSQNSSNMLVHHMQQPPCLVVESCNQSILSGYYISRTKKEIDDGNDTIAVGSRCKRREVRDGSLSNEAKFITSPVSQESFAPDLLGIHVNATPVETSELPTSMKCVVEESSILNSGSINFVSKKALIKELPERLSSNANHLLTDAGWKIEPRVRSDRSKLASYYIAPQGKRVITSLSQAWKTCGRSLYSSAMNSEKETNGKEWTNIDQFWSDLTNTLSYIEENIQLTGTSISLLKRWQLLDPFIAVVCISRKISVLREGRPLKAVHSATFILSKESDNVFADESTDRVCQLAKLNASSESILNQNSFPPAAHLDYICITDVPGKQQTWQICHDVKTSNQHKKQIQKPSNCAVTERKSFRYQAVCKGSNLHESRYPHQTSYRKSTCLNNEFNDSENTLMITEEDSCCTYSKTGVDFSGQDSLPSVLETSPINDSDSCKATSIGKSFRHHENSIPSSSNDELLVGSGSCKRKSNEIILKEVRQKRRVISAQHRVYGKNLLMSACCGSLDLPSHSNSSSSMEIVADRLEMPPSSSKRCCNGSVPAFNHQNDLAAEKASIEDKNCKDSGRQASGSGKKIRKKSKKISEIRVGKVNYSCGIKYTEAKKFHFDDKHECHLESPCNQEGSHMLAFKSKLDFAKKSTCATGESILTRNSVKKMERSETKTSKQHVKDKKRMTMPLDDEVESKLIHSNIGEVDVRGPKKIVCNSEGLDFQFPYQSKLLSSAKKAQLKCTEDSVVASDECKTSTIGKRKNIQILNSLTSAGKSPDSIANPKVAKVKETEVCKKNRWKRPRGFRINDDDLLIAAIIKNKDYVSCHDKKGPKLGVSQPKKLKRFEIQRGGCKLQLRTPGKSGMPKDGLGAILGARTVLCWLIERGVLSLKDVLQYRNPKNNDLVKEGWITRDGILCKCCMETFSVSAFKTHCGSKHQKPSSNLFLESGRSYTLCQLQAWSAEYKARKSRMINMGAEEVDQNDDTCGLCVDGGELICCDNCPSTYHQTCLTMQDLPEGSWYCHNCICKSCGEVVKETKEDSRSLTVRECSQCEHKYHEDCAKKLNSSDRDREFISWFCGRKCKEVYLGLRTRVGILNCLADGYSWTILRCNHDDQKINSTQKIAFMAECNTKLAIALSIMEECFLPMIDPRTGINMIPHVLYNRGSNFIRLNYQGFYTVVLEKSDEVISVASIRVHGVTVAEMPLISTSSEHRRQGMCRRLIDAIEKMLRSFKVRMLVLSAIPGLVETWTSHFGFKPIGDAERRILNHVNLMLFPGTELLVKYLGEAKAEEAGSDAGSLLRSSQCSNPDGFSETVLKTTGQAEETSKTDSHDGALFLTPDVVYLRHEEHDCQQNDILISCCDTNRTTPKPDDNCSNIPDPFWSKEENLHIDESVIHVRFSSTDQDA